MQHDKAMDGRDLEKVPGNKNIWENFAGDWALNSEHIQAFGFTRVENNFILWKRD